MDWTPHYFAAGQEARRRGMTAEAALLRDRLPDATGEERTKLEAWLAGWDAGTARVN